MLIKLRSSLNQKFSDNLICW